MEVMDKMEVNLTVLSLSLEDVCFFAKHINQSNSLLYSPQYEFDYNGNIEIR